MNRFLKLCFVVFAIVVLASCTNRAEKAASYNDSIIGYQKTIIEAFDLMDSTFRDTNATKDRVGYSYANLQSRVKLAILALDSIGSFQMDPSLQLSARELFRSYEEMTDTYYKTLVEIKLLPATSVSSAIADTNFAIQAHVHMQSKNAQDKFLKTQEQFGKKFHLEFE